MDIKLDYKKLANVPTEHACLKIGTEKKTRSAIKWTSVNTIIIGTKRMYTILSADLKLLTSLNARHQTCKCPEALLLLSRPTHLLIRNKQRYHKLNECDKLQKPELMQKIEASQTPAEHQAKKETISKLKSILLMRL